GGAYVPLDPEYPEERLAFMMEDAQVSVLLTQQHLLAPPPAPATPFCLDSQWATLARFPSDDLRLCLEPLHLAYAIYTSGSTGQPKCAVNTHQGISNRLLWMQE